MLRASTPSREYPFEIRDRCRDSVALPVGMRDGRIEVIAAEPISGEEQIDASGLEVAPEEMNRIRALMDEDLRQGAVGNGTASAYMVRGLTTQEQ